MNVTLRIGGCHGNEELEKKFVAEAAHEGMIHLNGHRYCLSMIQVYLITQVSHAAVLPLNDTGISNHTGITRSRIASQ